MWNSRFRLAVQFRMAPTGCQKTATCSARPLLKLQLPRQLSKARANPVSEMLATFPDVVECILGGFSAPDEYSKAVVL